MITWVFASIGVIIGSVAVYLLIRHAQNLRIPLELRNLAMIGIPAFATFVYNILNNVSMGISLNLLLYVILAAIFLSWLSQITSLKSLELAPNPGYSLIISKSYVVMTTFLAIPLFGSSVSALNIIAIAIILFFAVLVMYQKGDSLNAKGYAWLWLSIYTFFGWGFLALFLTWLLEQGLPPTTVNMYILLFASILIGSEIVVKKTPIRRHFTLKSVITLMGVGLSATIYYQSIIIGYATAPNPGYINAVNTASIGFVTLFSAWIFSDELKTRKLIGVFGMIAGLVLLLS